MAVLMSFPSLTYTQVTVTSSATWAVGFSLLLRRWTASVRVPGSNEPITATAGGAGFGWGVGGGGVWPPSPEPPSVPPSPPVEPPSPPVVPPVVPPSPPVPPPSPGSGGGSVIG